MKKLLALILAAALALSLVACGGDSGAGDTNTPSGGNGDTTSTDTPTGSSEYSIGDTFSTDCIEASIVSYDILTEETLRNNPITYGDYLHGSAVNTYSEIELKENKFSTDYLNSGEKAYFIIIYSAKNVGKEALLSTTSGNEVIGYGNITLDYDNGYKFEYSNSVFSKKLEPLTDGYVAMTYTFVPMEVVNNTDKPLNAVISLPNSASNTDDRTEFIVNLR